MQLRIVAREPEYSYHGPHYRYALASHWWAPSTIRTILIPAAKTKAL